MGRHNAEMLSALSRAKRRDSSLAICRRALPSRHQKKLNVGTGPTGHGYDILSPEVEGVQVDRSVTVAAK
jgi:hypothetical protein